jgi:ribosomal protein S18 acetylase RimI-like enzyme
MPGSKSSPDPASAPGTVLRWRPMDEAAFAAWQAQEIPSFAQVKVEAGQWSEAEALECSRAEHASMLPQGVATPGHHFRELLAGEGGAVVGMLWFADQDEAGQAGTYVYGFEIDASARGQGLGAQALALLEAHARERGHAFLRLHVFADNATARRLYQRAGFAETNVWMRKAL